MNLRVLDIDGRCGVMWISFKSERRPPCAGYLFGTDVVVAGPRGALEHRPEAGPCKRDRIPIHLFNNTSVFNFNDHLYLHVGVASLMSSPTDLYLPPHLPYPIKIVAHAAQPNATVERGTRLLSYSFTHTSAEKEKETRFGTWDSSIEGTVEKWFLKVGETVSQRRAIEAPAVVVNEPCKHGMQLGGLCCLCGKDMTSSDYTGFSDASRASIQMTHAANGPTVSLEEAQRIERETADHLRRSRKLSLIVDLDQTIVHATVDPTVGEWITEGEAWEARRRAEKESNGSTSRTSGEGDEDEVNPNWEALKDVKKFRLGPEALGHPHLRGAKGKVKDKSVENEGCMYYIKPRPGWKEFLQAMATKYEMHVYTMGTRAYAEEVCAAIDPDGKIFGGRLLSRDESGSLTQKSLQRLFPCDQSMVVIIDDRADVWEWSPNLVKVIPYDFFVGIGDINSAFLPKLRSLTPNLPQDPSSTNLARIPTAPIPSASPTTSPSASLPSIITSDLDTIAEDQAELVELAKTEILARNADALDAQLEERPLAKQQELLQEAEDASEKIEAEKAPSENGKSEHGEVSDERVPSQSVTPKPEKHLRKALLKNDDVELVRVQKLLEEVHKQYYDAYEARPREHIKRRPGHKRPDHMDPYDVRSIIPQLRLNTLQGTHILFSSVIPLDTRPESTEIWRTAHAFGAKCYTELNRQITHVVAGKRGTVKVDAARRQGGIKIVWLAWFTDSIALWQRQDETAYLIDPESAVVVGPGSPPSDPHQISSDPEPDADDWDYERAVPDKSLALDEVDWDDINDEVEAAMNESDDEEDGDADGKSEKSGTRSGNVSEDDWTDESNSIIRFAGGIERSHLRCETHYPITYYDSTASSASGRRKRKRLRSITPSEAGGVNGDSDILRSPLSKRKKLAADRSGASRLKEAITADDLVSQRSASRSKRSTPVPSKSGDEDDDMDEEDEEEDYEDEEEDDFLARELGEDWG
ncbi:hypothetical protein BC835DRAFT_1523744 [Cytidiella melzeri]|nr:hypothetical protein BC835DRAFT_1523744 [Cytidiella melzeri]